MFFDLAKSLRSLTISPASAAIRQAHGMAQRRLAAGGAAVPASKQSDDQAPADFVLPADVDAGAVAAAVREKLGITEPVGEAADALRPLERRKLGGRVVLARRHVLRLGDGHFDRGRRFMHEIISDVRVSGGKRA